MRRAEIQACTRKIDSPSHGIGQRDRRTGEETGAICTTGAASKGVGGETATGGSSKSARWPAYYVSAGDGSDVLKLKRLQKVDIRPVAGPTSKGIQDGKLESIAVECLSLESHTLKQ